MFIFTRRPKHWMNPHYERRVWEKCWPNENTRWNRPRNKLAMRTVRLHLQLLFALWNTRLNFVQMPRKIYMTMRMPNEPVAGPKLVNKNCSSWLTDIASARYSFFIVHFSIAAIIFAVIIVIDVVLRAIEWLNVL